MTDTVIVLEGCLVARDNFPWTAPGHGKKATLGLGHMKGGGGFLQVGNPRDVIDYGRRAQIIAFVSYTQIKDG